MKISTSDVTMTSTRTYEENYTEVDEYSYSTALRANSYESLRIGSAFTGVLNYRLSNLTSGSSSMKGENASSVEKTSLQTILEEGDREVRNQTLGYLLLRLLMHRFGGDYATSMEDLANQFLSQSPFYYETETRRITYTEDENTSFSSIGNVVTEDGRELSFEYSLTMSRSFVTEEISSATYLRDMRDPLVINLDNSPSKLSDQKFYFDLDQDGVEEYICKLQSGRGFLALDKNSDGVINDGSELFGASTGDGFLELSLYDEDGNGWIDENDPIFDKLKIWAFDENGNGELYTLKSKGLGAICLKRVASQFSLNDSISNESRGMIRETSIFLYEDGRVGSVQHLDIAT